MDLRRFSKQRRPYSIPVIMAEKFDRSIKSAASIATSEPPATATPTSACLSAGASLTVTCHVRQNDSHANHLLASISGHGHRTTTVLEGADNLKLLLRTGTGEHNLVKLFTEYYVRKSDK